MNRRFFHIWDNSLSTRGAPWFGSGDPANVVKHTCEVCNRQWEEPEVEIRLKVNIERGSFWPDAIGTGGGTMGFYVSERVIKGLEAAGINYGGAVEAFVHGLPTKKLRTIAPPVYYWVRGHRGIELDYEASGYRVADHCARCGNVRFLTTTRTRPYVFKPNSWDGSDLFVYRDPPTLFFCTEKVLLLAHEHRWTNFRFVPADTLPWLISGWKGIDYLARKWPPSDWYPPMPSAGKSLDECIAAVLTHIGGYSMAFHTLLDFQGKAVAPLLEKGRDGTPQERNNVAAALYRLYSEAGIDLPAEAIAFMREHIPARLQEQLARHLPYLTNG